MELLMDANLWPKGTLVKPFYKNAKCVTYYLLCKSSDIIFLQETWLLENELSMLNCISRDHYAIGVTAMDSTNGIVSGRPYGGLAILWGKSICHLCKVLKYDGESRVLGIEIQFQSMHLLLINTYVPYCSANNQDACAYYLAKLADIIENYGSPYAIVMGDFNADLKVDTNGHLISGLAVSLSTSVLSKVSQLVINHFLM
jgi:exonuclease III